MHSHFYAAKRRCKAGFNLWAMLFFFARSCLLFIFLDKFVNVSSIVTRAVLRNHKQVKQCMKSRDGRTSAYLITAEVYWALHVRTAV